MQRLYKSYCLNFFIQPVKTFIVLFFTSVLSVTAVANVYTPNTFTDPVFTSVNNTTGAIILPAGNAGMISLRSSLFAADVLGGTHTVNLSTGTYNLTQALPNRQITIGNTAQNITINGNGPANTIINMVNDANRDRILFINPTGATNSPVITVSGIRFQNGYLSSDPYGGAAICAGGGSAESLTITNCTFDNNILPANAYGGAAVNMQVRGNLSIDNSTFTNNVSNDADGGAILFIIFNSALGTGFGTLNVTNSTFTNNSVVFPGAGTSNGGALAFTGQAGSTPFNATINNNTFTGNTADGLGGAISANNSPNVSIPQIHFNRIVNNTSTASASSSGLHFAESSGSVNAENNWWGCNTNPVNVASTAPCNQAGGDVAGGGALDVNPWLQLRTTALPNPICNTPAGLGNTTTVTTSFLNNSDGVLMPLVNLNRLIGLPVTWGPTTLGTLSAQQATIQASGTATATFTSNGTGGTATVNTQVDNIPAGEVSPARANITVNTLPIVTNPANFTSCVGGTATFTSTITGVPAPTITWRIGSTALVNGVQGSGSTVAGQGTNTLTITNVQVGDAAVNYNVQAVNHCGTAISADATLFVNQVTGGAVGSDQTICAGGDPALFTETGASTGSGALTYQWQSSTTSCIAGFTDIGGATGATYDAPSGVPATTYYRRVTISTLNGVPCTANSNCITVTVNSVTGGTVAANQTICSGGDPAAFTQTVASTGSGALTYQWQSSTTDCTTGFTDIGGATTTTYDAPAGVTVTTYYRRVTTSTLSGLPCTANSNCITVTVNSVTGGTVGSDQGVCSGGDPALFTEIAASTGSGALTYQWQISTTDCVSGFTNIGGATATTYNAPAGVTVQTYYRRITTSTLAAVPCTAISNCITVSITPNNTITLTSAAGTDNQTVTVNTPITNITYSTTTATGATFSGLPAGVTGSWAANVVTISGSPTTAVGSPFNYTVTLTGGCGSVTANGTITVTTCSAINQTVTASPTSVCAGGSSTITVAASQPGVNYTLRTTPTNTIIAGPTPGTGPAINFATGPIVATTTYNVLAETDKYSILLNGTQTGFTIPEANALDLTNNFTMEGWIKPNGNPAFARMFNKNQSYALGLSANQTQLTFTRHNAGDFSRPFTFVNGQWYHIASTYSGGTVEFFVNGTSIGTVAGVPAIVLQDQGAQIGSEAAGAFHQFNGNIDNVRIWSSIRTQAEIAANQQSFLTSTGNPTLAASWWISEGSGSTTMDFSANAINATALAGSWAADAPIPSCSIVLSNQPTVTVAAINTITLTSAPGTDAQTVCINTPITNITYTTTGATGATFSGLPAGVNGAWAANVVTISGTPTASGTFNYTVTLTGGCGTVTATGSITVTPTPSVSITGGGTFCGGTTVTLTATAGFVSYNWFKFTSAGYTALGITTQTLTVTKSGNYRVDVSNGACAASAFAAVEIGDYLFTGGLSAGDASQANRLLVNGTTSTCAVPKVCPGNSGAAGPFVYDLYNVTNNNAGPVCAVIGLTANCGEFTTASAYLGSFNPLNNCTNYLGDLGSAITGGPMAFEVTIPAGATIVIKVNNFNSGLYCNNYRLVVDIPRTAPAIITTPATTVCAGTPVTLTASVANSYSWSPGGATTQSINVSPSSTTTYTVTLGYGNNGCTATASQTITVNPNPVVSIIPAGPVTICQGGNVTLTASATCNRSAFSGLVIGSQEVPANASTARGLVNGTFNATTNQLTLDIVFNGLTGGAATAAHLHNGAPGVSGPVIIPFAGFPVATSGSYSNTYTLTPAQASLLLAGNTYVNIHNATFPGGEIRGQITNLVTNGYTIAGPMNGGMEVPPNASTSTGNFAGTYNDVTGMLKLDLIFNNLTGGNATAAHVHSAGPGVNGPVIIPLTSFPASASGNYSNVFAMPPAQVANFLAGNTYINIHNAVFPGGEIRGQIAPPTAICASNTYLWSPGGATTQSITVSTANTYTVTVTDGNNCSGSASVVVNVNPVPTVDPVANQVVCNGSTTAAVNFTGSVPGTVYNWTNNTTSIGLAASGTGNIGSFTAINTGAAPVVATITVTPTYTNGGTTCPGSPTTFTITVNPSPDVAQPADQVVCNGSPTAPVNFTGSVPGTIFNWTNNTTSIGLAASGTGNIPSFTATNVTNAPVVATITVTPSTSTSGSAVFNYTGAMQTWTVPAGVTSITVDALGARGGNGGSIGSVGGSGGQIQTTLAVTPGQVLNIFVGQAGADFTPGVSAFNGGGAGGTASVNNASGGGGATDIRIGGILLSNRVVVAGGGGGVGGWFGAGGGHGGALTGGTGGNGQSFGGAGGSQVGGGAGGAGNGAPAGNAGASGTGGAGGSGGVAGGGGGGGGYYGGGGGGADADGCCADGAGGGGGSNFTSGTIIANNQGVNFGNGQLTITYAGGPVCTGSSKTFTITVNPTATVNAVADQTVCNGAATTAVTFTSPTTGGTIVYNWTNNTTSIGLAAGGTGNIASFTATNSTNAPVTATITVTPSYTNGGTTCIGTAITFTITVNPTATVNAVANQVVCNGAPTTAVSFSSPTTGGTIVYNWTNNTTSIGLAASGTGDIASFTATNTGNAPVVATITVTPSYTNGGTTCTGTPITFTITVNPTATINAVADQVVCNGSATTAVNFSSPTTGGTIVYNWTNNTTSIGLAASGTGNIPSFTATNAGNTPVVATVTVTPTYTNGGVSCVGTPITFTITVNPAATIDPVPNRVLCNGATSTAIIFTSPTTGGTIVYNWTNSQPSIGLAASGTGNIPSFVAVNITNAPVVATITVTPTYTNGGVSCVGTPMSFTITVNPPPVINPVPNQVVCNNSATAPVNFTTPTTGGTAVYNWTNNNTSIGLAASGTGNIPSFIGTNATNAPNVATITVTMIYTSGGISCVSLPVSFTITVNPTPVVNQVANQVVCNGTPTAAINFTSPTTGGTIVYNWTNTGAFIGLGPNGTGNIPSFTATNPGTTPLTATIIVIPTYTNGGISCTGPAMTFTITVNPTPNVNAVANQVLCHGSPTAPVSFTGTVPGTVYDWVNSNTSIGLAATGTGNIASFIATNVTNVVQVATITVTPIYSNGGVRCEGTARTFTITVNPIPSVNPVADQRVCAGATLTVNFTGSVAGTVYNWTNTNTAIGLGASGTGNLNFVTTNTSGAPIAGTVTVTPVFTNGGVTCTGTPISFVINVNPTPTVNPVANQTVCNGAATAAITFSGPVGGTVFNWTNNNTSIGLGASGTGNIPGFTATNITNAPVTATITVTPVFTAGGVTCTGPARNFTITVNPTPSVNAIANQTVCNGATIATIVISGPVAGTVFAWTNNNTAIGLAGAGTGNIPAFAAINTTNAPITATITVTPTYTNGGVSCSGTAISFTITVNPTPTVNAIANQLLCNGSTTNAVTFTGSVPGTTYSWTNNNTAIGLAASGTGNIPAFTAINTSNAPITATITVTTSAAGCPGASVSFTITVNPTPTVNQPANQTVCDGSSTLPVVFTGSVAGTVYTWSNDRPNIGLNNNGTGNIPAFIARNNTPFPIVATITVTPTYNNGGVTCTGASVSFTITVNPQPNIIFNMPPRACLTDTLITLRASPVGGTWSGAGISGTTFSPSAAGLGVHVLSYTFTNSSGCTAVSYFNITVNDCKERHNVFATAIRLYPNPSSGQFNIRFLSDIYKEFNVKVVTASGQELKSYHFDNLRYGSVIPMDLRELPGGTYFLQIYNASERAHFPFVIVR